MHYELYLDSLFLLNFGMNLLLLCLVDHSMGHTATWYRLLAGAVVGAVWYLYCSFSQDSLLAGCSKTRPGLFRTILSLGVQKYKLCDSSFLSKFLSKLQG